MEDFRHMYRLVQELLKIAMNNNNEMDNEDVNNKNKDQEKDNNNDMNVKE